jgi:hypothetical protein
VATLTGAATGATLGAGTGGLIGALTREGVDTREADVYAEGVRRGGALVSVRAEEGEAARIEGILGERTTVDPGTRRAEYEGAGWTGYRDSPDDLAEARAVGAEAGAPRTPGAPRVGDVASGGVGTTGVPPGGVDPAGGLGRGDRTAGVNDDLAHAARGEMGRGDVGGSGDLRPKPGSESAADRDLRGSTLDPDLSPPPRR